MTTQPQLWLEGKIFTCEVLIPTNYEPLPVEVTYIVPPFDTVVEMWRNKEPEKAYPLFRQFIQNWSLEDTLTDKVLMAFLIAYPGTTDAIFFGWSEYMQDELWANEHLFAAQTQSIN